MYSIFGADVAGSLVVVSGGFVSHGMKYGMYARPGGHSTLVDCCIDEDWSFCIHCDVVHGASRVTTGELLDCRGGAWKTTRGVGYDANGNREPENIDRGDNRAKLFVTETCGLSWSQWEWFRMLFQRSTGNWILTAALTTNTTIKRCPTIGLARVMMVETTPGCMRQIEVGRKKFFADLGHDLIDTNWEEERRAWKKAGKPKRKTKENGERRMRWAKSIQLKWGKDEDAKCIFR